MIDALEAFGKRHGALASQVEVAEYVEAMAGPSLDERRQAIAYRLQGRSVANLSTQPPKTAPSKTPVPAITETQGNKQSSAMRWAYALVPLAVAAIAAALAITLLRPTPPSEQVLAPSAAAAALAPTSAPTPVPPLAVEDPPVVIPSSSAAARPAREEVKATGRERPRSGRASTATPPGGPPEISTSNPYR
jgi:hypothetical protein